MSTKLTEHSTFDSAKIVVEGGGLNADGKPKDLYLKGTFIQGGSRNQNGRIYSVEEIRKAVEDINNVLKTNSVLGELDHPPELTINLDRVSHMITEMYMDGPNGIGKLKIIPTPMGNIAKVLIESGFKMGVSSRGSGDVDHNGHVHGFMIKTVDLVSDPSCVASVPVPIYESFLGHDRRGTIRLDLAENANRDTLADRYLREEMLRFINSL